MFNIFETYFPILHSLILNKGIFLVILPELCNQYNFFDSTYSQLMIEPNKHNIETLREKPVLFH